MLNIGSKPFEFFFFFTKSVFYRCLRVLFVEFFVSLGKVSSHQSHHYNPRNENHLYVFWNWTTVFKASVQNIVHIYM